MAWWHYIIAILGGMLAGGMNSLAGYGSVITLSILMEIFGLPGNIANATNRVSILAMAMAGSIGYRKAGILEIRKYRSIIFLVFLGSLGGIWAAVIISPESFKKIFHVILILIMVMILVNPKRWIHDHHKVIHLPMWKKALIFLPIGFYGGFIQMGMGLLFLVATVLLSGYTILQANAMKLVVILLYTAMSVIIFHYHGLIQWKIGLVLGIGQALGSYFTVKFVAQKEKANLYAYRVMVVIIILVLMKNIFDHLL